MRRVARAWLRPALGMVLCGAAVGACSESDEPTDTRDGAVQAGPGGGVFDAGGGPGAGAWTDGGFHVDGGSGGATAGGFTAGGATAGGATAGGLIAGGFTAGGLIAGGFTAGGFISGGFTAGGFISGGFTAGGAAGGRDAGAGIDASVPYDAGPVGDGSDRYADLRQVCVDTINMYRATIGVAPLARANAAQEECSDRGAKYDGDMNVGHASTHVPGAGPNGTAGSLCSSVGLIGIQDACPGWPANGNVTNALKKCLEQMWGEGDPPGGVAACKAAYFAGDIACFEAHGHYINMSDTGNVVVSCGFYQMPDGRYWMNQDFATRR